MKKINSAAELKMTIQTLGFEHEVKGKLLKEQIFESFEKLKPMNIIKNTLHDVTQSPYLIDNMLGAVTGLVSGYVSRKIAVGTSHSVIRKIAGALLQFSVTNVVAKNSTVLKTVGNLIIQKFLHKNESHIKRL